MLIIQPCTVIPMAIVDAALYDDPQAALAAVMQSVVEPSEEVLAEIRSITEEMPLLRGKTIHYAEISRERLMASDISTKDRSAIERSFFEFTAFVVPVSPPILFINHDDTLKRGCIDRHVLHHELVHAEQVIRGDSLWTEEGQVWKGQLYCNDESYDLSQSMLQLHPGALYTYLCRPWEEEAFRRSEGEEEYKNKRMNAAIRSLFHNLQDARLVDNDPFNTEDYRFVFLSMCGEALKQANETDKAPDMDSETFDAYDQVLATCHAKLSISEVSVLRRSIHAAILKGGYEVPFLIERSRRDACINLYLACLTRLHTENSGVV